MDNRNPSELPPAFRSVDRTIWWLRASRLKREEQTILLNQRQHKLELYFLGSANHNGQARALQLMEHIVGFEPHRGQVEPGGLPTINREQWSDFRVEERSGRLDRLDAICMENMTTEKSIFGAWLTSLPLEYDTMIEDYPSIMREDDS